MTILGINNLQQALYSRLNSDTVIAASVSGVYDTVPEGAVFPYIVVGNFSALDSSTNSSVITEITFDIHAFSRTEGKLVVQQLASQIFELLHDYNLSVSGRVMSNLKFQSADFFVEEDGITYVSVQRFRAILN